MIPRTRSAPAASCPFAVAVVAACALAGCGGDEPQASGESTSAAGSWPSAGVREEGATSRTGPTGGSRETVESGRGAGGMLGWVRRSLISLENDLITGEGTARIGDAIEPARLVGIGESRHDTREQFRIKKTLVEHLVRDRGFRVMLLEESFPHASRLDAYVAGGRGSADRALATLAGWYQWDTVEMRGLVEWLRAFNEGRPVEDRVRIFGIDVTAPGPAVDAVLSFLDEVGIEPPVDRDQLGVELMRGDHWPTIRQRYADLTDPMRREIQDAHQALVRTLVANRETIVGRSSAGRYDAMTRMAQIGLMGNAVYCESDVARSGELRDRAMADNVLWVLESAPPDVRAVLWAHDLHVAKSVFRLSETGERPLRGAGMTLAEALGGLYVAIGGTFGSGAYAEGIPPGERHFESPPESTLDGMLAAAGSAKFALDLRRAAPGTPEGEWLSTERVLRAQDAEARLVPRDAFDMVYFVDEISRAEPSPAALARFGVEPD